MPAKGKRRGRRARYMTASERAEVKRLTRQMNRSIERARAIEGRISEQATRLAELAARR